MYSGAFFDGNNMRVDTGRYDRGLKSFGIIRVGMKHRFRLISRWRVGESTLDVGCADGSMLELMTQRFPGRSVGLEYTSGFTYAPGLEVYFGDAEKMPFRDGTFSTVVCSAARKHFKNSFNAMSEMTRVCAPKGRVIVLDPHPLLIRIGMRLGKFDPRYVRRLDNASSIAREMNLCGLRVIHGSDRLFCLCVGEKSD